MKELIFPITCDPLQYKTLNQHLLTSCQINYHQDMCFLLFAAESGHGKVKRAPCTWQGAGRRVALGVSTSSAASASPSCSPGLAWVLQGTLLACSLMFGPAGLLPLPLCAAAASGANQPWARESVLGYTTQPGGMGKDSHGVVQVGKDLQDHQFQRISNFLFPLHPLREGKGSGKKAFWAPGEYHEVFQL